MVSCRRDLDDARKHAKKATELEPKKMEYLDTLAEVNFRMGDRDTALSLMKKCLEFEPNRLYFRRQFARFKDQSFDSPTPNKAE